MLRRNVPLLAALFLVTAVSPAFAQTEDEIVAKFFEKMEKKQEQKVGFLSAHFSYGKLSDNIGYRQFNFSASSDLSSIDGLAGPIEGIFRTKEFGANFGIMVTSRAALKIGFDYWLKMGSDMNVDYHLTVGVLEFNDTYRQESTVNIYGFKTGFDYYLLNAPDKMGQLNNLAVKVGGGGGLYMACWDVWQDSNEETEPLRANAPGFWVEAGLEYPIGFFSLAIGADLRYFYLNLSGFESYNESSGELDMTYPADGSEIELDFSGFRGNIQLKRFFSW
ncbi:MAG: hypothetical protein JSV44_09110 [Candidatus Zixiibacteriota bacterium]|nr:MAG: hypothetical protein JSV44_09110 [candidate division Zixibacteria bacterium]